MRDRIADHHVIRVTVISVHQVHMEVLG